jgi:acyl carrier protein
MAVVKDFILDKFLQGEDPHLLTPTTELVRSGILDSLATLELVGFLEERFGIELEAHELGGRLSTLADIERLVTSKLAVT